MEDIVYLAVEIDALPAQVEGAGLKATTASLWRRVFDRHGIDRSTLREVVESHIHPADADRLEHAVATLEAMA